MDRDAFTPKLRVGRLYFLQLASVLFFDLIVLFVPPIGRELPVFVFLGFMTAFFPVLGTALSRWLLSPTINTAGIAPAFGPLLPWSAPCEVARVFPGLVVAVSRVGLDSGSPLRMSIPGGLSFAGDLALPGLPLVADTAAYVQALHHFAPDGHPVLEHFQLQHPSV